MNKDKTIELEQDFIVLAIPKRTLELSISAKVWNDSDVVNVSSTMLYDEIQAMFQEAHDGYIPADAVFTLNPYHDKTKLEELVDRYLKKLEDDGEN